MIKIIRKEIFGAVDSVNLLDKIISFLSKEKKCT
jgi:hypothetical protein